jgi:hypothetical protein
MAVGEEEGTMGEAVPTELLGAAVRAIPLGQTFPPGQG